MEQAIHSEMSEVEPSTMVILYELVLKDHGASYYFHAGENGLQNSIFFKGKDYYYLPIKADGFDSQDQKLPRPTVTADNTDSFFSLKSAFFKDFIGYPFIRTRTFVKFLHGNNFPNSINPHGTPTEVSYPPEKYIVNQKMSENENQIQFELVSAMEKESAFIPSRKIVYNSCQWQYRHSIGCGYTGLPVTDSRGNFLSFNGSTPPAEWSSTQTYSVGDYVKISPIGDSINPDKVFVCIKDDAVGVSPTLDKDHWVMDACPKNIKGCRDRFGETEPQNGLPFGGFPGTWEY